MRRFDIIGMSCAACSARVERAVLGVDGVSSCSVSLLTSSLTVEGSAADSEIIAAIVKAGYDARVKGGEKETTGEFEGEIAKTKKRLLLSLSFLLLLVYLSTGYIMLKLPLPSFLSEKPIVIAALQALLALSVMIINKKFFISGFKGLLHLAPNMDTLVACGSAAAFLYSLYPLFSMVRSGDASYLGELYFESGAMILTLITVGKLLEARAKGRTTSAIRALIKLTPKTATVLRSGEEITILAENLVEGDIFIVRPGESVAADGIVIEGESALDESALTGESIPVDKSVGDTVSAATINKSGALICRATRVGEDTALSQIIKMVSDASASKAPIAKIADKVSAVFVPLVMCIALITTAVWLLLDGGLGFAIARGISVLVISCPCALGLATPVAIMVGNGVGAKNGILFKSAEALETLGRVRTVALDKTGTITKGEPTVTDVVPLASIDERGLLRIACSLERKSEHPLAKAIVLYGNEKGIETETAADFKAIAGNGLKGRISDAEVFGGSLSYISSLISVEEEIKAKANALASEGKTPVLFAKERTLLGIIAIADAVKEDSATSIRELLGLGVRVVMLTGDNALTAGAVGREVCIDEIISDLSPEGKEAAVRELKKSGEVAMVGDGINDAPALTSADVGVAIGTGTDVAIDAAEVLLVNNTLCDAVAAIRISRATLKNIRENLFWAFFYNSVGIPIATGALASVGLVMSPMLGALAMSLSSVCVVSNALRLSRCDIYGEKKQIKREKKEKRMKKTVKIEGMMCPHCEARVKKILEETPQIESAEVSHISKTAVITLKDDLDNAMIKEIIEAQGYSVIEIE